jgi:hypothetical protein
VVKILKPFNFYLRGRPWTFNVFTLRASEVFSVFALQCIHCSQLGESKLHVSLHEIALLRLIVDCAFSHKL